MKIAFVPTKCQSCISILDFEWILLKLLQAGVSNFIFTLCIIDLSEESKEYLIIKIVLRVLMVFEFCVSQIKL